MATRRDQILDAVLAKLNPALPGAPAGLKVEVWRIDPLEDSDMPHINIVPGKEHVAPATQSDRSPNRLRTLTVKLEIRALPAVANANKALDPILAWATRQLFTDYTLGGKCSKFEETGNDFKREDGATAHALCEREYEAHYTTKTSDEEQVQ